MRVSTVALSLFCFLALASPGQDVTTLTPPKPSRGPELPETAPASLKGLPDDDLLAYMGIGVGKWEQDFRSGPRRNVFPPDLWALSPKAAALALASANLDDWERTVAKLGFADVPAFSPPESGWLLLRLSSGRHHFGAYYLPFGPGAGACHALSIPYLGPAFAATKDLDAARRRWLVETVGWLHRLRVSLRDGMESVAYPYSTHSTNFDVSLAEQRDKPKELVSLRGVRGPELRAPFPESLVCGLIEVLLHRAMQLPGPASEFDGEKQKRIVAEAVRTSAQDPKVVAPMWVEVIAGLAVGLEMEDLTEPLAALAARSRQAFPSDKLHAQIERSLDLQRNLGSASGLLRILGQRQGQDRGEVWGRLHDLAPAEAESYLEQSIRGPAEPDWYDWNFFERVPASRRAALLQRLSQDPTLPTARRAKSQSLLLVPRRAEPPAALEPKRIAAFLVDPAKPPEAREELANRFLYGDTEPSAAPEIREALASVLLSAREPEKLRQLAALVLGGLGDQRALGPLCESLLAPRSDDSLHTGYRMLQVAALAASAVPGGRKQALETLRKRLQSPEGWRGEIAQGAWLADLRELAPAIEKFAAARVVHGLSAGGGFRASSEARALLLAWREPDQVTRAQLELILVVRSSPTFHLLRPLLQQRVRAIGASVDPAAHKELGLFAQRIMARLENYDHSRSRVLLREAGLLAD